MSMFQENVINFIGNNLKKVSENSKPLVSKIIESPKSVDYGETVKSPARTSYESPVSRERLSVSSSSSSISSISSPSTEKSGYMKMFGRIIIFGILLFILWHYLKKYYPEWKIKIKNFFSKIIHRPYTKTEPSHYEKPKQTRFEKPNPMFNKKNNLNSNEILDYLLEEEKKNDTATEKNEWCFYGKSGNRRYCTLAEGNKCMSGEIFPSKDLCINPKLKR